MFAASCRALVDHELKALLGEGKLLEGESAYLTRYVQPASLDLPLLNKCYLVKDRVLPHERNVLDLIPELEIMPIDISKGGILLKGQTYLALCGKIRMPSDCRGSLSPKSSIGRVDIMVRGVFDNCGLYDTIEPGAEGNLWMEITPRSFNVVVRQGLALSQMMVFKLGDKDTTAPLKLEDYPPLVFDRKCVPICPLPLHYDGSVILHLGLEPSDNDDDENETMQNGNHSAKKMKTDSAPGNPRVIGWEALPSNEIVDLSKPQALSAHRFFRPLFASREGTNGKVRITLEKDRFYILATKERISVPTTLSAEMIPFSHHIGELRAHYAGFFDPGFGFGKDGSIKGTVGVLEVRPHETVTIFDGQPICLIEFFRNHSLPQVAYGDAGNSYQNQQGAKLAKYFVDSNGSSQ